MRLNYLLKSILFVKVRLFLLLFYFNLSYGQTFNSTNGSNVDLNGATLNNTNCASNRSVSFNVSGVGVLSSTNQLVELDLRVYCRTRLTVSVFLQAPNGGPCVQIASRLGNTGHSGQSNRYLDYKFRNQNACLNKQPDYEPTSSPQHYYEEGIDSRFGVFSTVGDIATAFNGVNANGTWTMYFSCTNSINCSGSLPRVVSAGLTFGNPIAVPPPSLTAGNNCANAVEWTGTPLCATTDGKSSTSNRPGTGGCSWLSTSENNLWFKFIPTEADVCINISGVNNTNGTSGGVQSIIVRPTNPGTPCDNAWTTVNCPRDGIYASDIGSTMSQNHCFTGVPGETYYLVVDGNAGAITEVYITGIDGLPIILAAELVSFDYQCEDGIGNLKWTTASESNNDYFAIDYSENGQEWMEIGRKQGSGSKKTTTDYEFALSQRISKGYFRLKQVDFDGKESKLKTIVANGCANGKEVQILPNPSTGIVYLLNANELDVNAVSVMNLLGNQVYHSNLSNETGTVTMDLSNLPKGIYVIVSHISTGERNTHKIVIE